MSKKFAGIEYLMATFPPCPLHGDRCIPYFRECMATFAGMMASEAFLQVHWIGQRNVITQMLPAPITRDGVIKFFHTYTRNGAEQVKHWYASTYNEAHDQHNLAVMETISSMTTEEVIADQEASMRGRPTTWPERRVIEALVSEVKEITKARLIELLNQFEAAEGPIPFEPLHPADADNLT